MTAAQWHTRPKHDSMHDLSMTAHMTQAWHDSSMTAYMTEPHQHT